MRRGRALGKVASACALAALVLLLAPGAAGAARVEVSGDALVYSDSPGVVHETNALSIRPGPAPETFRVEDLGDDAGVRAGLGCAGGGVGFPRLPAICSGVGSPAS